MAKRKVLKRPTNRTEYIDYIQTARRSMRASATQIKKRQDLPQFGAESFLKFEKRLQSTLGKRKLSEIDDDMLRTIYRDTAYLYENIKSTHLSGAIEAKEKWLPIKEKMSVLSKAKQDQIQELYNKYVSNYALIDRFRYEILETNVSFIYDVVDIEQALQELDEALRNVFKGGVQITDAEFNIRFPAELEKIRKRHS